MADAETLPAAPSAGSALPASLANFTERLRQQPLLARHGRSLLIVAAVLLPLIGWLLFSPPDRAPLYRSLPDADKAAVVSALQEAGMAVALDPQSGAVLLPPDDHARARMLLASQGLPRAAPAGQDLLADMPFGASRALEEARLKSAQERELARAIESLQGVEAARVIIAVPEPSPFIRERPPVTASVTVTLPAGRSLSDTQARAITHLVAGAVPGLRPEQVAIADQSGRLLAGDPHGAAGRAEDQRLQMQARMENRARDAVLAVLQPMFGADNVTAQVAFELDFSALEAARETYDREGTVRSEATSRATGSEPRAIGIPGALTNTVPAAAAITGEAPPDVGQGPTTQTTGSENATRNYEIGRAVEVRTSAGGTIRRITVAVALSADAVGPADARAAVLQDVEALVASAVGADTERGDRVTVAARPFPVAEVAELPLWREPVVVESSKWLGLALVAIVVVLALLRPMLKPLWMKRQLALAAPETADDAPLLLTPRAAPADYFPQLEQARLLAATDSARASAVARRLLAEDVR